MIIRETLPNGLQVVLEPISSLHSTSCGVWVKTGSVNENRDNNGISHVIEHMLFQGTETKSARELARVSTILGGSLNAFTSKECTSYYIKTLSEHTREGIFLLGDMICHSILDEELLEKEKGVILEEIDMYDDSAEDMVHELLEQEIWRDHPLGYIISGTKENVNRLTQAELKQFMERYYCGSNIVISAAGNFDAAKVLEWIGEAFGGLPLGAPRDQIILPEDHYSVLNRIKDMEQTHLDLAYPAIAEQDEEKYAFHLMNAVLGGSLTSRLFQSIREEQGLAYTVYSYGSLFERNGLLHIYAAMNPRALDRVESEIQRLVAEFTDHGISDEELETARLEICTDMKMHLDSTHYRMERNAKYVLAGRQIRPLKRVMERMQQVQSEEVQKLARHCFGEGILGRAVIGNQG